MLLQISVGGLLAGNHTFPITSKVGYSRPLGLNPIVPNVLSSQIVRSVQHVQISVTFGLFLMGLMSFVGWFLFAIFAGLGIPGIPIDLFRSFTNRPQRLDRGQIAALELSLQVSKLLIKHAFYDMS
jgi:hypothetical protein